jgi:hypothetical protein
MTKGRATTLPIMTVMMKSMPFSTSLSLNPNDANFNKQYLSVDCG